MQRTGIIASFNIKARIVSTQIFGTLPGTEEDTVEKMDINRTRTAHSAKYRRKPAHRAAHPTPLAVEPATNRVEK
jgi:hypothetical protein